MPDIDFTDADAAPADPTWVDQGSLIQYGTSEMVENAMFLAALAAVAALIFAVLMTGLPDNPNDGFCGHMVANGIDPFTVCPWLGY